MNNLVAYYRTNQKRVEVKTVDGKFKGKSSCNKTDEFSLNKGIKLAMARCRKKSLEDFSHKLNTELEKATDCFSECKRKLLECDKELVVVNRHIKNLSK